jgi:hypothetical protein
LCSGTGLDKQKPEEQQEQSTEKHEESIEVPGTWQDLNRGWCRKLARSIAFAGDPSLKAA